MGVIGPHDDGPGPGIRQLGRVFGIGQKADFGGARFLQGVDAGDGHVFTLEAQPQKFRHMRQTETGAVHYFLGAAGALRLNLPPLAFHTLFTSCTRPSVTLVASEAYITAPPSIIRS